MTASLAGVGAHLAAATAKAAAAKGSTQPSFGAALSDAQHTTTKPVVQPEGKRAESDTPQHPTLRTKPTAPVRGTTAPARKAPIAHPVAENDVAAATAVQATPAAVAEPKPVDVSAAVVDTASAVAAAELPATPTEDLPDQPVIPAPAGAVDPAAEALPTAVPVAVPGAVPPATDQQATPPAVQPDGKPLAVTVQPAPAATTPVQQPATPAAQAISTEAAAAGPATAAASAAHHRPVAATEDGTDTGTPQPGAPVTVTATSQASHAAGEQSGDDRENAPKGQAPVTHGRAAETTEGGRNGVAAYATVVDQTATATPTTSGSESRTVTEMPATQALPTGTMDKVNAAEHSVRVQVETDGLGRVTADLHTRPGEIGVHLSVPDDTGRALMAQRMDALRDSLGQSGTAVHLSLAAHHESSQSSQGQQGYTPREDRAPAQSAPQPHEAATPRATDGSPVTPATADGTRLVDVRA